MKCLSTHERVLTWLCVLPINENANRFKNSARILFTSLLIAALLCVMASSVAFFVKFVSIDLQKCLYTIFQFSGPLSVFYSFVFLRFPRKKVKAIFKQLADIYDACKYDTFLQKWWKLSREITNCLSIADKDDETFQHLVHANTIREWMWKNYFRIIIFVVIWAVTLYSGSIAYSFIICGEFNSKYLYYPLKIT